MKSPGEFKEQQRKQRALAARSKALKELRSDKACYVNALTEYGLKRAKTNPLNKDDDGNYIYPDMSCHVLCIFNKKVMVMYFDPYKKTVSNHYHCPAGIPLKRIYGIVTGIFDLR